MKLAVLILQIVLAMAFLAAGATKILLPLDRLIQDMGMVWIEDFIGWQVRLIGILEILGALGLALPLIIKSIPGKLMIYSAFGLSIIMIGAILTHFSRSESVVFPLWLGAIAALIGIARLKSF